MTPEEIEMIQADGAVIRAEADAFATIFYDTLFEIAPNTRALFPDDLVAQRGKLVDELVFLVDSVTQANNDDHIVAFVERTRALGRRHAEYGVSGADYASVQASMIAGLRAIVDGWDAVHQSAWDKLYRLIADVMREGAENVGAPPGS